jgi:uncharacterized protein YbbC (DUF1343 family)
MIKKYLTYLFLLLLISSCHAQNLITVGAQDTPAYMPLLKNKQVALVVNQTSTIGNSHLVDSLLRLKINIKYIFAPEHGFRGTADAGEHVNNSIDTKTGLPIVSIYGKNAKPSAEQLAGIEVVIFDIQDVGARFFTYISTMHYVMEACAEQKIKMIVLDRPNPNGYYVDGPVLNLKFRSFVGMDPIPIVHGLTVGELAQMINGEKWLKDGVQCDLVVIKCKGYTHKSTYSVPVKTSPNMPNNVAIKLYPSLCLLEGVEQASLGRGTMFPFQVYGGLQSSFGTFTFTPMPIEGMDKNPKFNGKLCYGKDLRNSADTAKGFTLAYVLDMYQNTTDTASFFIKNNFFDKLAGTDQIRLAIKAGKSEIEIRKAWQPALNAFKLNRKKYLLYPDFDE